jgi:two-component system cell cycle sensor histidine kinase/response regulator CckA
MNDPLRLLLVEDSADDADLLIAELHRSGFVPAVTRVETAGAMAAALARGPWDLVISDHAMPHFSAPAALEVLRQSGLDLPFIVVSGTIGEDIAVTMMKSGAHDYLLKHALARLGPMVRRELTEAADRRARRAAEQRVREQAELLDQATDAIYVRNLEGRLTYWNEGAERLFGWPRADVIGRTLADLNLRELDPTIETKLDLIAAGGWSGEREYTTRDGRELHTFTRLTVVRPPGGPPHAVFAIVSDISEKKRLELRLLQAQRLDSLGALASGLAHDLNNVLSPVLLATQILKDRLSDPIERKMVATLEASALRGAGIVRQVLTFARGAAGERKVLQLRHLVREMVDIATETFPPGITVRCDLPSDLAPVLGDVTQLHQILMNLCINARDAMPGGGTLLLQGENITVDESFAAMTPGARPGPHICIRVADTGTGIAPEHAARIFEPFFTTKEEGKGTGLGLATVLGLTRSHGGFLRFHTKPGRGTTFEVYLPAAPSSAGTAPPDTDEAPPRGADEAILVVDDEPAIRAVTSRVLEQHGYRPTTAADGMEAVAAYVRQPAGFAAVITDMAMPGMDGPTLVRTLHRINPALPVLGMTGTEDRNRPGSLDGLGVSAMLAKPFTAHQLLAALYEALHVPPGTRTRAGSGSPWRGASASPFPTVRDHPPAPPPP